MLQTIKRKGPHMMAEAFVRQPLCKQRTANSQLRYVFLAFDFGYDTGTYGTAAFTNSEA